MVVVTGRGAIEVRRGMPKHTLTKNQPIGCRSTLFGDKARISAASSCLPKSSAASVGTPASGFVGRGVRSTTAPMYCASWMASCRSSMLGTVVTWVLRVAPLSTTNWKRLQTWLHLAPRHHDRMHTPRFEMKCGWHRLYVIVVCQCVSVLVGSYVQGAHGVGVSV